MALRRRIRLGFVPLSDCAPLVVAQKLDLGARYATAIQGKNTTFRVNVNNLFDKNYYSGVFGDGYATVGTPMTVLGSVTVDF